MGKDGGSRRSPKRVFSHQSWDGGAKEKSGPQEAADRSSGCPGMAPGTPRRRGYRDPMARVTSAPDLSGGQLELRAPRQL